MQSRVQKYLAKKKSQTPKESAEHGELSPLPNEELMQIFSKLKGRNGKTPSEDELIKIMLPLIPKVKDGKTPTKEELVKLMAPLIPEVKDGETPKRGVHYFTKADIEYMIDRATPKKGVHYNDGTDGKNGKNGKDAILPSLRELAISAINLLETFEGEDRLDVSAIKGIHKLIRMIVSQETINFGGPGMIFHDDTLTGSGVPGDPLRVVGGTGSGVNFEEPVGLIDGSNTIYIVTNRPKAIILNQQTYFENDGYTVSGAGPYTITITGAPVPVTGSTLRSMY